MCGHRQAPRAQCWSSSRCLQISGATGREKQQNNVHKQPVTCSLSKVTSCPWTRSQSKGERRADTGHTSASPSCTCSAAGRDKPRTQHPPPHHHRAHRQGFEGPAPHAVTGKVRAAGPRALHTWLGTCHAPGRAWQLCSVHPTYSRTPGISGWETHRPCTHQAQEMGTLLPGRKNPLLARSSTGGNTALPSFSHQNLKVYFTWGFPRGFLVVVVGSFNSRWVHMTNVKQERLTHN